MEGEAVDGRWDTHGRGATGMRDIRILEHIPVGLGRPQGLSIREEQWSSLTL